MCSSNTGALLPYGLKIPTPGPYFSFTPSMGQLAALDFQRPQFCDYGARLQYGIRGYASGLGMSPYPHHLADPYTQSYLYKHDLRARYIQEEPKPSQSYIGLIAMAILSHKDKKLVLSDIYQWILDNYAYFRTRGPGWRNSIRHNLSLNDCFIKSGRSANGKGHYWAVHPANVDDFGRGDFRRRRAQRKVRKHMGLAVPDEDDSPSPSPTPQSTWGEARLSDDKDEESNKDRENGSPGSGRGEAPQPPQSPPDGPPSQPAKRRLFDMESILAPDTKRVCERPAFSQLSFDNHVSSSKSQTPSRDEEETTRGEGSDKQLPKPEDEPNPAETHGSSSVSASPSPASSPTRSLDLQESSRHSSGDTKGTELYMWPLSGAGRVRPSAFHTTSSPAAWNTYATYLYPMLASSSAAAYPMMLPQLPTLSVEAANRIRQTMNGLRSDSPAKTDSDEQ